MKLGIFLMMWTYALATASECERALHRRWAKVDGTHLFLQHDADLICMEGSTKHRFEACRIVPVVPGSQPTVFDALADPHHASVAAVNPNASAMADPARLVWDPREVGLFVLDSHYALDVRSSKSLLTELQGHSGAGEFRTGFPDAEPEGFVAALQQVYPISANNLDFLTHALTILIRKAPQPPSGALRSTSIAVRWKDGGDGYDSMHLTRQPKATGMVGSLTLAGFSTEILDANSMWAVYLRPQRGNAMFFRRSLQHRASSWTRVPRLSLEVQFR